MFQDAFPNSYFGDFSYVSIFLFPVANVLSTYFAWEALGLLRWHTVGGHTCLRDCLMFTWIVSAAQLQAGGLGFCCDSSRREWVGRKPTPWHVLECPAMWQSSERQCASGLQTALRRDSPVIGATSGLAPQGSGGEYPPFKNTQHCSASTQVHTTNLSLLPAGFASQSVRHCSVHTEATSVWQRAAVLLCVS